jgi:hypothetical protein
MTETSKIEYRVKKVTITRKTCPSCRGTGKRESKLPGGGFKTENCIHCINGVAPMEHITEITLKEALNEMGIYKLIENTVKEILTKDNKQT